MVGLDAASAKRLPAPALRRPAAARGARPGAGAASPALVLLDEPFDALDAGLRAQVRAEVREAAARAAAPRRCSSPTTRRRRCRSPTASPSCAAGAIVQAADPQTLYRDPVDAEVAGFLGEAVLLAGELRRRTRRTPRSAGCRPAAPAAWRDARRP